MPDRLGRGRRRNGLRWLWWATLLLLLGHGARVTWRLATNPGLQGDLRIYRAAAQAWAQGRDPYSPDGLVSPGGKPLRLPFVYPPATLPLLRALLIFDDRTLAVIFFGAKLGSVVVLILLWRRWVGEDDLTQACLFLLCALGYNQTIKLDLRAGNVSVFEQLALWSGAAMFRHGRLAGYATLVATAAFFKLTLAALLLVLLVEGRRGARIALLAFGGLALVHGASWALRPDLFAGFLRSVALLDDRGSVNPSTLAIVRDLLRVPPGAAGVLPALLCLAWAAALAGATAWAWSRRGLESAIDSAEPANVPADGSDSERRTVLRIAFFLYALVMPRFKDYSYILLVPPSTDVVVQALRGPVPMAIGLVLLCTHFFAYQSWLTAVLLYGAYLLHLGGLTRRKTAG